MWGRRPAAMNATRSRWATCGRDSPARWHASMWTAAEPERLDEVGCVVLAPPPAVRAPSGRGARLRARAASRRGERSRRARGRAHLRTRRDRRGRRGGLDLGRRRRRHAPPRMARRALPRAARPHAPRDACGRAVVPRRAGSNAISAGRSPRSRWPSSGRSPSSPERRSSSGRSGSRGSSPSAARCSPTGRRRRTSARDSAFSLR